MRIELEKRLAVAQRNCKEARAYGDMYGVNYYDGQISILKDLLSNDNTFIPDWECHYGNMHSANAPCTCSNNNVVVNEDDIMIYNSMMCDIEEHNDNMAEFALDNQYFTNGLGKNVLSKDALWFTSDEVEAFRVIWQRRLSNLILESND